jgi:hypothetical protein
MGIRTEAQLHVRVSKSRLEDLRRISAEEDISLADLVRRALAKVVLEHRPKGPLPPPRRG